MFNYCFYHFPSSVFVVCAHLSQKLIKLVLICVLKHVGYYLGLLMGVLVLVSVMKVNVTILILVLHLLTCSHHCVVFTDECLLLV